MIMKRKRKGSTKICLIRDKYEARRSRRLKIQRKKIKYNNTFIAFSVL